jgi:hypothetical protein
MSQSTSSTGTMVAHPMTVHWSDDVQEILDGDHALMLAYATPANGVVLLPVSNFAVLDRAAGVVSSVNTSVGAWKKLDRIRRNPRVALAFHTREHAATDRPEYMLVQGTASLPTAVEDYPSTILPNWERFEPWADQHSLWKRWRRVYALRIPIEIAVERILVWPDQACRGPVEAHGSPLPPDPPEPQAPPKKGTAPRIDQGRAAKKAASLPHALLGWVGADGFPMVAPVEVAGSGEGGILLDAADGLVPPGGRRAGLTAHWFSRSVIGQNQRKYTGWVDAGEQLVYAPHTQSNYRFPASLPLFRLVSGGFTRLGLRGARRAGFAP